VVPNTGGEILCSCPFLADKMFYSAFFHLINFFSTSIIDKFIESYGFIRNGRREKVCQKKSANILSAKQG